MDRRLLIGGGIVIAAGAAFVALRFIGGQAAAPALDAALAHLPPGFTAAHGPVAFDPLTGAATVEDLAVAQDGQPLFHAARVRVSGIAAPDAAGTPTRIAHVTLHDITAGAAHIGRADLDDIAPATLRDILDPAAYPGGKPTWTEKRPVLGHAELHDIALHQEQPMPNNKHDKLVTDTTAQQFAIDGVRLSQLATSPDYAAHLAVLSAAFQQVLADDSSRLDNLDVTAGARRKITIHFDRLDSGKVDSGRGDRVECTGVVIQVDKPGSATIADFAMKDIDVSGFYKLVPEIDARPGKTDPAIFNAVHIGGVSLRGLKADFPTAPLFGIDSIAYTAGTPATLAIRNIALQTTGRPLDAEFRAQLEAFGKQDFTADIDEAGTLDTATGKLDMSRLDINLHDLALLHFTLNADNIPALAGSPKEQAEAWSRAALTGAAFRWDDHSLLGRIVNLAAAQQHTTPDKFQARLAVSRMAMRALVPNQPDAADQIVAFLQNRHSLAVTVTPPQPITAALWISTPAPARPLLLGVHVSGN